LKETGRDDFNKSEGRENPLRFVLQDCERLRYFETGDGRDSEPDKDQNWSLSTRMI